MTSCCAWSKSGCARLILLLSFNDAAVPEIPLRVRLHLAPPEVASPQGCGCTCACFPTVPLTLMRLFSSKNPPQGCVPPPDLWRLFSSKKSSSRLHLPLPDSCGCSPQKILLKAASPTSRFMQLLSSNGAPLTRLMEAVLLKKSSSRLHLPLPDLCGCSPQKILLKAASPTSRFMQLLSSNGAPRTRLMEAVLLKKSSSRLRLPPPDS
uniref:Secreted protein n=1 Tax=Vitis vinifera TaxID=29760 RepID=A5BS55_VITVI|nr:hypothetical protein VITISV_020184 [Vitis vinifera]